MRIVQISDFHFMCSTWNPFRLFSKRLLGHMNGLLTRRSTFSHEQLEPLAPLFKELSVDLILFGGDFTTTALREEFELAKQFVEQFSQPWLAIPGNHDHYTYRSWRQKHFYRYFSNQRPPASHPAHFFTLKDHGIEAHRIHPGWWLLAFDTARATNPCSSRGFFSKSLETYTSEILNSIPPEEAVICFNHYPCFFQDEPRRTLLRGEALRSILRQSPKIRLYLHGHTHRHAIADLQSNQFPVLLDSGCCVQKLGGTWNLIDLFPDRCETTAYRWNQRWEPFRTERIQWQRN